MLTVLVIALALMLVAFVWGESTGWYQGDGPAALMWLGFLVAVVDVMVIVILLINGRYP